jgi:uncharacterized protein YjbJ (UPF0337 family)
MNWDQIKGNWLQVKGKIKERWSQFSEDELNQIAGQRDRLLGKLKEKYGLAKKEAERQLEQLQKGFQKL